MHFSYRGRTGLTPAARAARYRQLAMEADTRSNSSVEDIRDAYAELARQLRALADDAIRDELIEGK